MALDPYGPCPCGSGKKFKWCCQPIRVQIDRAFQQDAEGQHETALRIMDEVTTEHAGNPEAWGRKAQLLYQLGKVEESEQALQKAFDLNPDYPFGHLLRGMFRHSEGEFAGAALLLRKAAEVYDPEARDALAHVYAVIADCEMKLNKPVAAHAALRIAVHCEPAQEELRQNLDLAFGEQSRLPAAAKRPYSLMSPPPAASGQRRAAWDRALASAQSPRLGDLARVFDQLTKENADDAAAWYNLGVARAWLGDNRGALEALDRYVTLETDETKAADAWALGEVLRCGQGMEEQADYLDHWATFQINDPQPLVNLLDQWQREGQLLLLQAGQEEGVLAGLVLEKPAVLAGGTAGVAARLAAHLTVFQGLVRLSHPDKGSLDKVKWDLAQRTGPALSPPQERTSRAGFGDILTGALVFPSGPIQRPEMEKRAVEQAERYFEEEWAHRPLRSLNLIPPLDAAGDRTLRKKLRGVIQFLQDCAGGGLLGGYDFDRLRRKLGLLEGAPTPAAGPAGPDIGAMGPAELAGLQVEPLAEEQLELAYQTALKIDAQELAARFARALVGRPATPGRADRFPFYSHLVQHALREGNADDALNYVNEGERVDCEHNEGRRRNDYELRRGQVHVKRGEADRARETFERLIERVPTNLRYRGSAAEGMLALRQSGPALRFAEQGLAKAREQNDRDSEGYFQELVAAARKQGG